MKEKTIIVRLAKPGMYRHWRAGRITHDSTREILVEDFEGINTDNDGLLEEVKVDTPPQAEPQEPKPVEDAGKKMTSSPEDKSITDVKNK